MLPDVSAAASGGEAVGLGERVRRCVSKVVCAVRDVSISWEVEERWSVYPNGEKKRERSNITMDREREIASVQKRKKAFTVSAPCLFFHGMQRGNLVASSVATASDVSTARESGVSQLAFLLMPSFSWPASMRNS